MVETITPGVHGGSRRRWGVSVAAHALGATLAAAAFGAVLGAAGGLLGAPWGAGGLLALAGVGLLYAGREALGLPIPVPEGRRQVPDWWRTFFSPPVSAFLYGLGLGVGFLTYLQFGTLVAVAVAAVVTGSPWWGALLLAPFGLVRGLTVLLARDVADEERGGALVDALAAMALRRWPRAINVGALLLVAAVAAGVAARSDEVDAAGVAAAIVAGTFAWSTLGKILRPGVWVRALRGHRLTAPVRRLALVGVPLAEAGVVALAAVGARRVAGGAALVLLSGFSLAIVRAARFRRDGEVPCGCFGSRQARSPGTLLGRNAALAFVALVALVGGGGRVPRWELPSAGEALPATLAIVGVAIAAWAAWRTSRAMRGGEGA